MSWLGNKRGPSAPDNRLPGLPMREVARAQAEERDAVFHGTCLGCAFKKGNATGFGLQWCMGCAFFDYNANLPNLCTPMPSVDTVYPEDM